jgi:hypothetical protein
MRPLGTADTGTSPSGQEVHDQALASEPDRLAAGTGIWLAATLTIPPKPTGLRLLKKPRNRRAERRRRGEPARR